MEAIKDIIFYYLDGIQLKCYLLDKHIYINNYYLIRNDKFKMKVIDYISEEFFIPENKKKSILAGWKTYNILYQHGFKNKLFKFKLKHNLFNRIFCSIVNVLFKEKL